MTATKDATAALAAQIKALESLTNVSIAKAEAESEANRIVAEADKDLDQAVIAAAKAGASKGQIGDTLGVSRTTFAKYYSAKIDKALRGRRS